MVTSFQLISKDGETKAHAEASRIRDSEVDKAKQLSISPGVFLQEVLSVFL